MRVCRRSWLAPSALSSEAVASERTAFEQLGLRHTVAGLCVLAFCAACKGEAPNVRPAPSAAASAAPVASAPPATRPLDPEQSAARAFLDAWVAAQNAPDFAAYSTLYADPFVGIKRVGDASFRFDRRGWLADRKTMFAAGARVNASQISVTKSGKHSILAFEQEFVSPNFRDKGRKVLALVATPAGLRIAREEMLSSRVDGGGGSSRDLPGFFAVAGSGVVLRSRIEDRWLTPERLKLSLSVREPPENDDQPWPELPDEGPLTMNEVVLPAAVRAMRGKRMFVTVAPEDDGKPLPPPCESRIVEIGLKSSATPAFESVRGARRHDHVYGTYVEGVLEPPCPGGLWASETPPHPQYLPVRLQGTGLLAAQRAFRAQSEHAALQKEHLSKARESADWYDVGPDAFELGPRDGARWIFVVAYRFDQGERSGTSLTLLFEQAPRVPELRRVGLVDLDGFVTTPRLAFDLEGDGQLELLTGPSGEDSAVEVFFVKQRSLQRTTVYFTPDFMCPG
jgi:ketosteroid isomerase-like protein